MADTHTHTLGDVIRNKRAELGFSLRDVAKRLEITPSYLSDIENDRRVPSEQVTRTLAKFLNLDFDDLMALAGRFGEDAERYLRRTPAAGALFRKLSEHKPSDEYLKKLLDDVEKIGRKKGGER